MDVLPLSFEPNEGQADQQVKYVARGQGYSMFLTSDAAVLGLRSADGKSTDWIRLELRGASANATSNGEEPLAGKANYFVGKDPAKWRTGIPTYARVRYHQVYPGVDLIYYGHDGKLEHDFEVAPGANPNMISWHVDGVERIWIDSSGNLVLGAHSQEVRFLRPTAYQGKGDQQRAIPVHFEVNGQDVRFEVGSYNPAEPLLIDPVLTYSTYLGGIGSDAAYGIALDASGDAYVTGVTASTNFPITLNSYQTTYGGDSDAFVTEFNPTGTGVVFSTYLGGTGDDIPAQLRLDSAGDIYVVGSTTSNNFPVTTGVFQPLYDGNQDAFLTEMKSDGSALINSTYIGGSGIDYGTALTFDASGDIYVVGSTNSVDFPTLNPLQLANVGLYDAFVTEVSPKFTLLYSTYLGGSLSDYGTGIAIDSSGNLWVSGYTYSSNFPTQNALQSTFGGGSDLFLTEFVPGATSLLYSTYLGGSSIDRSWAMYMDSGGNIYLTGDTESPNFPVTPTAYQSTLLGTDNAFLTKVGPGGTVLIFSTLIGGSQTDQSLALTLDSGGNIYITGFTQSIDFPTLDAFQNSLGISGAGNCGSTNLVNVVPTVVCPDAFVTKFGPSGIPVYSSFLGGSGTDSGQTIAVDPTGAVYVAGGTASPNFPATFGAYQWLYQGVDANSNAFIAKIEPQDAPSAAVTPQQIDFGSEPLNQPTQATAVTLTNAGSSALSISGITASGDFQQTNNCGTSLAAGSSTCTIQVTFNPTSTGLQTGEISIADNSGSGTQGITLTGNGVSSGGSLEFIPSTLDFPATPVGQTSSSISATLVNNGTQAVTMTNIVASAGFAQSNNCGINFPTVPASLNVGQSCQVVVNFTPSATGTTSGSISITSNAIKTTTGLTLSGTGSPIYTLSSNARSSVLLIGTTTATFTISASGPSSILPSSITLSCNSGVNCTFSPSAISPGVSSQVTVTGLSATTANPLNFAVVGTKGTQTSSVGLTVFFADYSLYATPTGTTISAGNAATYTITVATTNGFNQPVLLSCGTGIPAGTVCYWNPPSLTPSGVTGTTVSSTLTITSEEESSRVFRHRHPPLLPPGSSRWVLPLALLALLGGMLAATRRRGLAMYPRLKLAVLFLAFVLLAFGVGCEDYVNPININPYVNGTPAGTYTINLIGTLGNTSKVTRTTTVNLSVLP